MQIDFERFEWKTDAHVHYIKHPKQGIYEYFWIHYISALVDDTIFSGLDNSKFSTFSFWLYAYSHLYTNRFMFDINIVDRFILSTTIQWAIYSQVQRKYTLFKCRFNWEIFSFLFDITYFKSIQHVLNTFIAVSILYCN